MCGESRVFLRLMMNLSKNRSGQVFRSGTFIGALPDWNSYI